VSDEIMRKLNEIADEMPPAPEPGIDVLDLRNELSDFEARLEQHFDEMAGLVNALHDRVASNFEAVRNKLDEIEQSVTDIVSELPAG
jgi:hypothetical protein